MADENPVGGILSELSRGMVLEKCRGCTCMEMTLHAFRNSLTSLDNRDLAGLRVKVDEWIKRMDPVKFDCMNCEHCYPASAMEIFDRFFGDYLLPEFFRTRD